ncbi:hypothetical protein NKG94_28890 [Micromonospora sp. M12]
MLVTIGLLLIVLLFRRSRQDRKPSDEAPGIPPGNPGGTTYRAGGVAGRARSPRPGVRPAAAGRRLGTVPSRDPPPAGLRCPAGHSGPGAGGHTADAGAARRPSAARRAARRRRRAHRDHAPAPRLSGRDPPSVRLRIGV